MKKLKSVTVKRRADEIKVGDVIMRPVSCDFRAVIRTERWAGAREDFVELHFGERDYMLACAWHEQIVKLPAMASARRGQRPQAMAGAAMKVIRRR